LKAAVDVNLRASNTSFQTTRHGPLIRGLI